MFSWFCFVVLVVRYVAFGLIARPMCVVVLSGVFLVRCRWSCIVADREIALRVYVHAVVLKHTPYPSCICHFFKRNHNIALEAPGEL